MRHARLTENDLDAMSRVSGRAAHLYALLCLYRDEDSSCWPTRDELASRLGVSTGRVSQLLRELTGEGLLERRQTGPRRWVTTFPDASGLQRDCKPGLQRDCKAMEQTSEQRDVSPNGDTSAASYSHTMQPKLVPVPEPIDPANECRKAWATSYRNTHRQQPPRVLMSRVAGKIKEIARTDPSLDEWREWYRASTRAGARGSWDVVNFYGASHSDDRPSKFARMSEWIENIDRREQA